MRETIMKPMTAAELKNSTGEVVRTLKRGDSILLTFRGKPLGTITPLGSDDEELASIRPYEEAWADIEQELRRSKPRFATWEEAEDEGRSRR